MVQITMAGIHMNKHTNNMYKHKGDKIMSMKINNENLVKRWDSVMNDICCEHVTINTELSELENHKQYYDIEEGISVDWMLEEAQYWLSCYYEKGNCRCDDRFEDEHAYKDWASETGKLKRLIARLENMKNKMIVEWA